MLFYCFSGGEIFYIPELILRRAGAGDELKVMEWEAGNSFSCGSRWGERGVAFSSPAMQAELLSLGPVFLELGKNGLGCSEHEVSGG